MTELNGRPEVARNTIVLGQDVMVFQQVTPKSSTVFPAWGLPSGSEVEIGGAEEVASFFLEDIRQPFVLWKDSGEKHPQYFRLVDTPPITRMMLSPVSEE
ncbi:MAG: hypothetical protein AAB973_03920 [Patescibacteria group bacterium]